MADEKIIFSMNRVGKILPSSNRVILKDICLSFFYGAKIGIIGLNGSGKSTLMKIIAGVEQSYQGEVVWAPGYSVGYLEQEPQMDDSKTVLEVVQEGVQEVMDVLKEYEEINQQFCDFINKRAATRPLSDVVLSGWVDTTVCQIRKVDDKWVPKGGPILQADGSQKAGSYADYPVFGVSYLGAGAYTAYLVETELGYTSKDSGYYLPTEAQWEYAAAGSEWNPDWENESIAGCSDETAYNKYMWSCRNCDSEGSSCLGSYIGNADDPNSISGSGSKTGGTHPVGKLLPNYLGIYDLSGNVCEICSDYFNSDTYPYGSALNPRNTSQSSALSVDGAPAVCVRGGNWFSYPSYGITWTRDYVTKQLKYNFMGFRVMLPLK